MQFLSHNVQHKVLNSKARHLSRFCHSKVVDNSSKVYLVQMSDSMHMIARLTSLSRVIDVRRRLSISLSLEKERSALQLVTIRTKYILRAIATLGSVQHALINNQFVQKQLSADISWLIVFEYISKHGKLSDIARQLSRSLGYESTSVLAAVCNSSGDNVDRQLKQPNRPASSL